MQGVLIKFRRSLPRSLQKEVKISVVLRGERDIGKLHTIGIAIGKTVSHLAGLSLRGELSRKQLLHFTSSLQVELSWHGSLRQIVFPRPGTG